MSLPPMHRLRRFAPWLLALLLLALGAWVVDQTEWVEVREPRPPQGDAARLPHYAAMRLLRALDVQVVDRPNLDTLPPPRTTLLLSAWNWSMFPERAQRLQDWVRAGGHLVVPAYLLNDKEMAWVPAGFVPQPRRGAAASAPAHRDDEAEDDDEEEDEDEPSAAPAAQSPASPAASTPARPAAPPKAPRQDYCHAVTEPASLPAAYPPRRDYRVCGYAVRALQPHGVTPLWGQWGSVGYETLRVPLGQGQVTVFQALQWHERELLEAEHARSFVATLGLPRPGDTVWIVLDETRAPLPAWLWSQAWIALLLGAFALLLWGWRHMPRFGPLRAPAERTRRSMGEQVRGTAEFLWHRDPASLHAAALRALDEAARRRLPHWDRLTLQARAQALAAATRLDAAPLQRALDRSLRRSTAAWPPTLSLIEQARRRLLDVPPSPSTAPAAHVP